MEYEVRNAPVTVAAVRIDNKKMTLAMLEQIPIYSLWQHVCATSGSHFEWEDHDYDFICRISAVPVIKGLKAHFTKTITGAYAKDNIDNKMDKFKRYKEFGLWAMDGELYLHPVGYCPRDGDTYTYAPFYDVDESWHEVLDHFNDCFFDVPRAIIGV